MFVHYVFIYLVGNQVIKLEGKREQEKGFLKVYPGNYYATVHYMLHSGANIVGEPCPLFFIAEIW